jgi:hypothetical protein
VVERSEGSEEMRNENGQFVSKLNNYSYVLDSQGRIDYVLVDIVSPKYGLHQMLMELDDIDLLKDGAVVAVWRKSTKSFYANQEVDGKTSPFHRRIFSDARPDQDVMHKTHSLDNRRRNLKLGSRSENQRDRKSHRTGRLVGTSLNKRTGKWQARVWIKSEKKHKYLGCTFATELEAHQAFLAYEKTLKGE